MINAIAGEKQRNRRREHQRGLGAKKAGEAFLRQCCLSWVLKDEQEFSKQRREAF